ncbi:MAG: GNAT family N-acetyltransferase [Methanobacteriota archaeon]|nr:MAG: GNAT family N-acetyltransferase [Euryarchaeota archaeon]
MALKESWEIRRASLHDRDALAALCATAVGRDDYVIDMLKDFILHGVVHVALDGDRIVGMMHYAPAIDGSAWLAIARTDPKFRRRGVAAALIQSFVGLASRSRVPVLRLWSAAKNAGGNASAKASGFREVARFSRVTRRAEKGAARAAAIMFETELVEEIQASPLLRLSNGYVPYERYFVSLTPANIHLLANAGTLLRVAGGIALVSARPEDDPDATMEFGLLAGDPVKVLRAIPAVAPGRGAKAVAGFLPHDRRALEAARMAGFETVQWGVEAVLYERPVVLGPASYRKRRTYAEIAAGKREGYAALALLAGSHEHGHTGPHEDRWNR